MTIPDGFGLLSIRIRARWRTLALYPAVCMGVTTVFLLVAPARYRAEARFILNRGSQSSLSGLAAQLGFVAPAEASKSPEFYQDLVTSRDVLDLVASGSYAVAGRQNRVTLLALWGGDTADLARAKEIGRAHV